MNDKTLPQSPEPDVSTQPTISLAEKLRRRRLERGEPHISQSSGGSGSPGVSSAPAAQTTAPTYGGSWLSHQAASIKNDEPPEVKRPSRTPVGPPEAIKVEPPKKKMKM